MAYSTMFKVNCPDSILAMSSTVLMSPSRCLPLERMRVRASRAVEAFLNELGVAKDRRERGPELMAHVGDKLRLVLASNLKLAALPGDFLEQASVLKRNRRLVGEALHEADDRSGKLAWPPTA
jgi:hypothetical protein